MNRQEDVLFLFLTSHGSEGGWLSTRFDPFRPRAFVARQPDAALDDAGTSWRVIVLPPYFSGAFIGPLADDNTPLLTAGPPERAAFGSGRAEHWIERWWARGLQHHVDTAETD